VLINLMLNAMDALADAAPELAIARTIVEAHGGHIAAASSPEQGTTFSFELPLLADPPAAAAAAA